MYKKKCIPIWPKKKKNPSWFWLSIELVMAITTIKSTLLLLRASQWKEGSRDQNSWQFLPACEKKRRNTLQSKAKYTCIYMYEGRGRERANKQVPRAWHTSAESCPSPYSVDHSKKTSYTTGICRERDICLNQTLPFTASLQSILICNDWVDAMHFFSTWKKKRCA